MHALKRLTRRQLVVLAALFAGDMAVLITGFMIVRDQPATVGAAEPVMSQVSCQAIGAQRLAERNLAGVARLDADGSLHFELSGQDTTGNTLPRDQLKPVEAAWDALAAAVALPEMGCGPYRFVRVDVPDPSGRPGARMLVEVNWIDLRAWGKGELEDGELAARSTATTYLRPEANRP